MVIRIHMDSTAYPEKPKSAEMPGIKKRLQQNAKPRNMELANIIKRLEKGHAISPAVMSGMSAAHWQEQQLFMVDIDNDNTDNIDDIIKQPDCRRITELPGAQSDIVYIGRYDPGSRKVQGVLHKQNFFPANA